MRPIVISKTDDGSSSIAALDIHVSPFNVGLGVVVANVVDYTIQHTFDNVLDSTVTPVWFNHATLVGQTTNQNGNYAFPVRGIKILNNAGTAANGVVTLTVIQAG